MHTTARSQTTFRMFEDKDWEAVQELHRKQTAMLGKAMDLPDLRQPPIALAVVEERDGEIVGCSYFEGMMELGHIGADPQGIATLMKHVRALKFHFRSRKVRHVRAFVEKSVEKPIAKRLERAGFTNLDQQYSHYALEL
jgi:hypothetical protein